MQNYIDDAVAKGAKLTIVGGHENRASKDNRRMPLQIEPRRNPLAMYYFGADEKEQEYLLNHIQSGGVCINDITLHYVQEDLPFGGIGASGMGAYHGRDGFRTFTHERAIYSQTMIDILPVVGARPPFGDKFRETISNTLGPI